MLAQWTGDVVGKMHIHGITAKELADAAGWNPKYLSSVLNEKKKPKAAESYLTKCLEKIIAERNC